MNSSPNAWKGNSAVHILMAPAALRSPCSNVRHVSELVSKFGKYSQFLEAINSQHLSHIQSAEHNCTILAACSSNRRCHIGLFQHLA